MPSPKSQPEILVHYHDHIEPGQYRAYCRSAQIYRDGPYARWVCALQFDVLDDSLTRVVARLTGFWNLGSGDRPRCTSRRARYWALWISANGGQPPKRSDRLSPKIFEGRHAVVLVDDVSTNFKQMTMSESEVYSVVREVVSWETGAVLGSTTNQPATNFRQA